jgi:hypothetical protein
MSKYNVGTKIVIDTPESLASYKIIEVVSTKFLGTCYKVENIHGRIINAPFSEKELDKMIVDGARVTS